MLILHTHTHTHTLAGSKEGSTSICGVIWVNFTEVQKVGFNWQGFSDLLKGTSADWFLSGRRASGQDAASEF